MARVEGPIADRGPTVDVRIAPSSALLRAHQGVGRPRVSPMSIAALVDTGASCSAIDRHLVIGLGLSPTGTIHTPSTRGDYINVLQYDIRLTLGSGQAAPLSLDLEVVERDFAAQGFLALLGRDVLDFRIVTFDGPARKLTIEWI